jgi:glutamyl-tRNA synthetase
MLLDAARLPLLLHRRAARRRARASRAREAEPGYDGLCRGSPARSRRARRAASRTWSAGLPQDGRPRSRRLRGEVEFEKRQIDDQVLLKSDGFPTYHLANVVDDHLMEITHVIRAEEWISSTPKHVVLYDAFGWQPPEWIHMPLLRNADKSKISKRKNPVSLDYYRDAGILPRRAQLPRPHGLVVRRRPREVHPGRDDRGVQLRQRLARRAGLRPREALVAERHYLREMPPHEVVRRLRGWLLSDDHLMRVVPLVRERIRRFDEFIPATEFFFSGDLDYTRWPRSWCPRARSPRDVRCCSASSPRSTRRSAAVPPPRSSSR